MALVAFYLAVEGFCYLDGFALIFEPCEGFIFGSAELGGSALLSGIGVIVYLAGGWKSAYSEASMIEMQFWKQRGLLVWEIKVK